MTETGNCHTIETVPPYGQRVLESLVMTDGPVRDLLVQTEIGILNSARRPGKICGQKAEPEAPGVARIDGQLVSYKGLRYTTRGFYEKCGATG